MHFLQTCNSICVLKVCFEGKVCTAYLDSTKAQQFWVMQFWLEHHLLWPDVEGGQCAISTEATTTTAGYSCQWGWLHVVIMLSSLGAGIAQWLECRTRDWKVAGSNPCWNSGRIFFSRVDFLCWLLFRYPFHPRVTTVARKRSRSFCQKCRWQVTAKHAYTLRMWLCMKWHGAWCTQDLRQDGCSFMWHQPCQRCKYTTSVDIQKTRYKS